LNVIKNKNQHTSVVLTTLQDKITEKENYRINASKIEETKLIQDSMNNYLVDKDKIDVFVGYLENIGVDFSSIVSVKSIEVSKEDSDLILVRLSVNGTFSNVINTINLIENIPYQINITKIYLNKDTRLSFQESRNTVQKQKTSKTPEWQADISFSILSLN
jgi:hypothetical protein